MPQPATPRRPQLPNDYDLRSEDISEILGTPPSWLVRWGTLSIIAVFLLLLIAGWIIRYPDVITARVEFTTETPPVDVVARSEGHIERFFVQDNDLVEPGTPLLVLENAAKFTDVELLDQRVGRWESVSTADSLLLIPVLSGAPALGELRNDYANFLQQLEAYKFNKNNRPAATNASSAAVQDQVRSLERGINADLAQQRQAATEVQVAQQHLATQQQLFEGGLISRSQLQAEQDKVAVLQRNTSAYQESILRKRNEISQLQRSIGVVRFDNSLDANSSAGRLRASLSALRTALDQWKQSYLLTSPIAGRVALNKFYAAQQYVQQGEPVLTIVPPTDTKIMGRSRLPIVGSGKVEIAQRVIIKLDNYPHYEFGTLEGYVIGKSAVPKDNAYAVTIGLDSIKGTTTNFNRTIAFQQQLQGEADIITANKRLLQRIVDQLFASPR
jgi:multidrug resistance efflux pump